MKYYVMYGKHLWDNTKTFIKWMLLAALVGMVVGLVGTAFSKSLKWAATTRIDHPWLLYLLPFGGLVIAFLYRYWMRQKDKGTNLVLAAIASGEEITPKLWPLIFISTVITHLFGGSAGREGATFQIGGCLGNIIGRFFHLDESDKHTIIMCGMSAGFATLFGTPMAAAIFAMEVISVGVMYYGALVPCVFSAYVGMAVAGEFDITYETYKQGFIPAISMKPALEILVLGILCAVISGCFCYMLHKAGRIYREQISNPFLRSFVGGLLVIGLVFLVGNRDYIGDGMNIIARCFTGSVAPEAFAMKMIFTAVTLGAGFKGGEIVPSIFVGSTFGCLFGQILGMNPAFTAACGAVGIFCGVTNCPIASLLLGFELFGFDSAGYFIMIVAVSYMLSGYYGLYDSQKIMYSKMKTRYVNRKINNRKVF